LGIIQNTLLQGGFTMTETITNPEQFERFGCVLVQGFLDPVTLQTVSSYLENKIKRQEWREKIDDHVSKFSYYADPLIETILVSALPLVSETCGKELYPTYSYARVYQPGEELEPHVDRPSCEISVTVNVASKGRPSPIWMHYGNNDPHAYTLDPGDAVVYKGCEAKHWRDTLKPDQINVQFMLHYVDKFGPHLDRKYDARPSIGHSSDTRRF
jgi:hypothetical protein